jgi:hypothetical protein
VGENLVSNQRLQKTLAKKRKHTGETLKTNAMSLCLLKVSVLGFVAMAVCSACVFVSLGFVAVAVVVVVVDDDDDDDDGGDHVCCSLLTTFLLSPSPRLLLLLSAPETLIPEPCCCLHRHRHGCFCCFLLTKP